MLDKSLSLGRYFGFKIEAHWSLLIIFALIATHLGFAVLPQWHPDWSVFLIGGVAVAASVIFFASIAIHELAHATAARGYGLDVSSITLFLFGGVSNLETEPDSPGSEAVIAIVGPIASIVLGVAMLGLTGALVPNLQELQNNPQEFLATLGPLATVLIWAGPINLLLAVFNMIPAFPMDGGRVVRAGLWGVVDDLERATVIAANITRFFSWTFIGIGIAMALGFRVPFFGSGLVNGLWIAVIGWFIGRAAKSTVMMQRLGNALEGVPAREVAGSEFSTVSAETSVQEVVDDYLKGRSGDRVVVVEEGKFAGLVTIDDAKSIDKDRWSEIAVREIMRSRDEIERIDADSDAFEAFRELQKIGQREVPVTEDDGELAGVLRLEDFARWMKVYGEDESDGHPMAA